MLTVDAVFHALAHPIRRDVVERLGRGPATVSELAAPFPVALPTFCQHLAVLERSGVVRTRKRGRVRTCELATERLSLATDWLERQRGLWTRRLDSLDAFLLSQSETPE